MVPTEAQYALHGAQLASRDSFLRCGPLHCQQTLRPPPGGADGRPTNAAGEGTVTLEERDCSIEAVLLSKASARASRSSDLSIRDKVVRMDSYSGPNLVETTAVERLVRQGAPSGNESVAQSDHPIQKGRSRLIGGVFGPVDSRIEGGAVGGGSRGVLAECTGPGLGPTVGRGVVGGTSQRKGCATQADQRQAEAT